ncbi:MAG TPA: M23 family metallopeptidase [Burkholderiales bacterium]|nr:M23 family metallopeptidase [Burkholderiales bacterium]
MDRFPLAASAAYNYAQRFTMQHRGVDIMAPLGTPVVAVEDGIAWATIDPKGGNVVYLDGESGLRYYYAHLASWTPLLVVTHDPKVPVKAGDQLGYIGNTGNAATTATHLHFQMRRGSLVIDPFDDLMKVDPHRRGTRPSSAAPAGALLLLALLWLASKGN